MRTIRTLLVALLALLATAPALAADKNEGKPVAFVALKNYFHNSDAPLPTTPVIRTEAEFNRQFGMAAAMGSDGHPTPVNWKKQVVLAVVLPETNVESAIDSVSLWETGPMRLQLRYQVRQGRELAYTVQPVYLMAVDRKWGHAAVGVRSHIKRAARLMAPTYTYVGVDDEARRIKLSLDYPLSGPQAAVDSARAWIEGELRALGSSFTADGKPVGDFYPYNQNDAHQLAAYYQGQLARLMKALDAENAAPDRPCSAELKVRKVDEGARYVTYEATAYTYSGGAHGSAFRHGVTLDKADGHRMRLVAPSDSLRKGLTERLLQSAPGLFLDVNPVTMPVNAPYLVDGELVFVWQRYEIAAGAAGMPSLRLHLTELDGSLTPEGRALEGAL